MPVLPGAKFVDNQQEPVVSPQLSDPVVEVAESLPERALELDRQLLPLDDLRNLGPKLLGPLLGAKLLRSRLVGLVEMGRDGRLDQLASLVLELLDRQFLGEHRDLGTKVLGKRVPDLALEAPDQAVLGVGLR